MVARHSPLFSRAILGRDHRRRTLSSGFKSGAMLRIGCRRIVIIWRGSLPMGSRDLEIVGKTIRQLREAIGISQEELAFRASLHRTYIGGVERGERNLGVENLIRIARALDVSPTALLEKVPKQEEKDGDG
ncbi:helix-turn-helix transcriptional regulator [Azospirillum sp.]|uniref:helix-turn-helix domain-containing protein n=1 Tax=Azospirillum sp. TaxID=34012 RepID=UPI00260B5B37|nr:helix-turn-helix transcriptional regulator [Azospirillum sp.]